ncbi:hypothetical protein [Rheinheimera aquimaris]|uniref:hypothetical protein n=1 Tax=Rheinheimera aquimaris TaxID=412437 RepID=UPI003A980745
MSDKFVHAVHALLQFRACNPVILFKLSDRKRPDMVTSAAILPMLARQQSY